MQTVFGGDLHWILVLWVYLQRACFVRAIFQTTLTLSHLERKRTDISCGMKQSNQPYFLQINRRKGKPKVVMINLKKCCFFFKKKMYFHSDCRRVCSSLLPFFISVDAYKTQLLGDPLSKPGGNEMMIQYFQLPAQPPTCKMLRHAQKIQAKVGRAAV